MRRFLVFVAVAVFAALAVVGGSAHGAKAAPTTWNWVWYADDGTACMYDPGNAAHSGDLMVVNTCGVAGTNWGPSPSSFGSGWYSVVAQNTSHGEYCLTDTGSGTDGVQLRLQGCNGSASQAWSRFCDSSGDQSIVDYYGQAIDLYGNHDVNGQPIVAWHLYGGVQSEPPAEQWNGLWDTLTC